MLNAIVVSYGSKCFSPAKGAIIVKQDSIVSSGCITVPKGLQSCKERGYCLKRKAGYGHGTGNSKCISTHAEANAIFNAVKQGISTFGTTIYCTHSPCYECAKLIMQAGIMQVYYLHKYDNVGIQMLLQSGIQVKQVATINMVDINAIAEPVYCPYCGSKLSNTNATKDGICIDCWYKYVLPALQGRDVE